MKIEVGAMKSQKPARRKHLLDKAFGLLYLSHQEAFRQIPFNHSEKRSDRVGPQFGSSRSIRQCLAEVVDGA